MTNLFSKIKSKLFLVNQYYLYRNIVLAMGKEIVLKFNGEKKMYFLFSSLFISNQLNIFTNPLFSNSPINLSLLLLKTRLCKI